MKIETNYIINLYVNEKKSLNEINKITGLSVGAIHSRLKSNGIKTRSIKEGWDNKFPDGRLGENTSNWKGGVTFVYCIDCNKRLVRWQTAKRCKSCARRFEYKDPTNHPNYIDGRTPLYTLIRALRESKNWSLSVFKRDNFTCVHCGDNKGGNLEADHIKPFCILMDEFLNKYKEYSPIYNKKELCKLAETYIPFWDINNGRTLCESCHKNTDTYGAKKARRKFKFKQKLINL